MSNFIFLQSHFPDIAKAARQAEENLYDDANTCIFKLGMMAEMMAQTMCSMDSCEGAEFPQIDRLRALQRADLLPTDIASLFHVLRENRNRAVHEGFDSQQEAATLLHMAHTLACWFMQTYGDWQFVPSDFVMPLPDADHTQTEEQPSTVPDYVAAGQIFFSAFEDVSDLPWQGLWTSRRQRADTFATPLEFSEAETRRIVDMQLRQVGWEADAVHMTYSKGARPTLGRNMAIAEWPVHSAGTPSSIDYALFVGDKLVGIIEAKQANVDVSALISTQLRDYAMHIRPEDWENYGVGMWRGYAVPFLFATNGRAYVRHIETKSGMWFRDVREEDNSARALQGWYSPKALTELLAQNEKQANEELSCMESAFLFDSEGLNLRPYQGEAVQAVEAAVQAGQRHILLAMATGTGKTRTVMALMYRLLKAKRFRRILFLVDRHALGMQASEAFAEVRLEDFGPLAAMYGTSFVMDAALDKDTRIHVATVQAMIHRVSMPGDALHAVSDYDLIIVDEAHREYSQDLHAVCHSAASGASSRHSRAYHAMLDYFDAVKIALTATPAWHITSYFGAPVYHYSFRRAVLDGYLVDYDAPHVITTKLATEGIRYVPGEVVPYFDPQTGELTNSAELEDELFFAIDSFNDSVLVEEFNRAALTEIAKGLNPEGEGKTLIFAVNDAHADLIVHILEQLYDPYGISGEAIMKITGKTGGGNPERVQDAIRRFRNERYPNIVVTVDLLATGVDIPRITTLVFLRRVQSRILFEQMLGRATRPCPEIGKTHFEIYDAVGVYEALRPVSSMNPVALDTHTSLAQLQQRLDVASGAEARHLIDQIQLRVHRHIRGFNAQAVKEFMQRSEGMEPQAWVNALRSASEDEAQAKLRMHSEVLQWLDHRGHGGLPPLVLSHHPDELLSHTRGYGQGQNALEYLQGFQHFIATHLPTSSTLQMVCRNPCALTRAMLQEVRTELDSNYFTETQLNSAWQSETNQDIVADISGFVRHYALGTPLHSHAERVDLAFAQLKMQHAFTRMQLDWLERIGVQWKVDIILDSVMFTEGAFHESGGWRRCEAVFEGKLEGYLQELRLCFYQDGP